MRLYLDASAIVPLLVREASSVSIDRLVKDASQLFLLSDFAAGEVASAIARLYRIQLLTREQAIGVLSDFDTLRSTDCETPAFEAADVRIGSMFVRQFDLKLRLPDAIHAATCQRLGATLVTFDQRLADAAATLGIAVTVPA